jgi:glyoxylase-like metal-dependent hydrolase (beta-lactamase superfamily II)
MRRSALFLFPVVGLAVWGLLAARSPARSEVGRVERLAPDVYFYEGDLKGRGHCNNGWVVFEDYVLVIDANFPSGARETLAKIREITEKPVRFAFDTHHHGDHAYGNQVWVENGAVPVAHTGVAEEMKKYEPARWEDAAKGREDVRQSKLKPPSVLFPETLIFDDGKHRVELRHFGVAHTRGDGFAWLPKEKILFTGDACVNGPHNYMGDGDTGEWVRTLTRARRLAATTIAPGHGPSGAGELLEEQILYIQMLRQQVKRAAEGKSPEDVQGAIPTIRGHITADPRIARYVGDSFPAQVAKVYQELTGKRLPDARAEREAARWHLAWHHPHEH